MSLKCIETLTFNITDAKKLQELLQQVESLERSCREQIQTEGGLVLRPMPSLGERAKKIKLKYKRLHKCMLHLQRRLNQKVTQNIKTILEERHKDFDLRYTK